MEDDMVSRMSWPARLATPLGDALRCIRLRTERPRWVGKRWIQVTVKQRAKEQARRIASAARSRALKPWHPHGGRESPREEHMSWRRSMIHYAYPGWMAHHQREGLAPRPYWCPSMHQRS